MALIVADTDVLIDYLHESGPGAAWVKAALVRGDLHTTAVTAYELLLGNPVPRKADQIRTVLNALDLLPLDRRGSEKAAALRKALLDKGRDIGMADCLIAGIVMAHGGTLMTRNTKHFSLVEGLRLALVPEGE